MTFKCDNCHSYIEDIGNPKTNGKIYHVTKCENCKHTFFDENKFCQWKEFNDDFFRTSCVSLINKKVLEISQFIFCNICGKKCNILYDKKQESK